MQRKVAKPGEEGEPFMTAKDMLAFWEGRLKDSAAMPHDMRDTDDAEECDSKVSAALLGYACSSVMAVRLPPQVNMWRGVSQRMDAQAEYLRQGDEDKLKKAFTAVSCYSRFKGDHNHELLYRRPDLKHFLAVARTEVPLSERGVC